MGKWRPPESANKQRINEQIRVTPVRVIGADGAQLGILPTDEALRQARALDLDLVEVAPTERPPVCRIMDYGKFKYQQKKRQHKGHAHQVKIKEIRVRPKTGDHDIQVKVSKAREFLGQQGQGDRHGGVPRPGVGPRRRRPQGDRRRPGATGRRLEGRGRPGPSRPPHDLHAGAEISQRKSGKVASPEMRSAISDPVGGRQCDASNGAFWPNNPECHA